MRGPKKLNKIHLRTRIRFYSKFKIMSDFSDDYDDSLSVSDDEPIQDEPDFSGEFLNKKYVLIMKIGYGAFATVWLAYNVNSKRFFAIKVQSADNYEIGLDEVETLQKISSSKCKQFNKMVDNFTHSSEEGDHVCMVFELLAGSVYDLIRRGKYSQGLPLNVVKHIIKEVLIAMDNLNRELNILHTDIKPENILIGGIGNNVQDVINQFNKSGFHNLVKKYRKKRRKSWIQAVKRASKDVITRMDLGDELKHDNRFDSEEGGESESESGNNDVNPNFVAINEKYFVGNLPRIKLSDFGGCYEISDNMDDEIQTRYYMAPEIMLGHKFSETCDVWSVGCMLYELLTGEILFDPDKKKRFNRDRHHLYDIQQILGMIPKTMIENSSNKSIFFRNNGLIKGKNKIEYKPLSNLLINKVGNRFETNDLMEVLDFMYRLLEIDPMKRPTPKECLKHSWLQS